MARKAKKAKRSSPRAKTTTKKTVKSASAKAKPRKAKRLSEKYKLDARRDTLDFRDRMFTPTLVEVPARSNLGAYRRLNIPVLDQGNEGACVGYGLATVANFLLGKLRPDDFAGWVSPRMLYVMAKRYDEWPGEHYSGSSARGGMKGWHKHGVCTAEVWKDTKYKSNDFTAERSANALNCLLGAYFRVNHKDLVAMHAAIAEVGVVYASASVHSGWDNVGSDGRIPFVDDYEGGHVFAIVGYDREGFWIQNSWGPDWGDRGLAHILYDDWLKNGDDAWVARLGVPVVLNQAGATAIARSGATHGMEGYVYNDLRNHIITLENDGRLREKGAYGLTSDALEELVTVQIAKTVRTWGKKRLMIYAHGGLTSEDHAIQFVANHRQDSLAAEVFPLAIIWRSDALTTIENILQDAVKGRRSESALESAKDFLLDRLDDTLEPLARVLGGKALWDEMKENATRASTAAPGGMRKLAAHVKTLWINKEIDEVSLVGYSAGSVMLGPFAQLLKDAKVPIANLTLWAPACTTELFHDNYANLIQSGAIAQFDLYTLSDKVERDDNCARIYNKSLLYLVSDAFEKHVRNPFLDRDGEPLLGMEKFIRADAKILALAQKPGNRWVTAPDKRYSDASHHGDFGSDDLTFRSTLARISGGAASKPQMLSLKIQSERTAQVRRLLDELPRKATV